MPSNTEISNDAQDLDPVLVKRASEVHPTNSESILLSAKLSRTSKGLTLFLKSPILEAFFRLLAEDKTITISTQNSDKLPIVRWKIGHVVQYLNTGLQQDQGVDTTAYFPTESNYSQFMVNGGLNLQVLTTKGLSEGVVIHSDVPMTTVAMKAVLETLKKSARGIYLSFCVPVEGHIDLTVREQLTSPGGNIIE
jgi:hypothetical protein